MAEPMSKEHLISDKNMRYVYENFDWEVKYNRWTLRFLGLWPLDDKFRNFKFFVCMILLSIFSMPPMSRTLSVGTIGAVESMIEALPLFYVVVHFIIFKYKNPQVKDILIRIYENWQISVNMSAEHRKPMLVYGSRNRLITLASIALICMVVFGYLITMGDVTIKKLPLQGIFPFVTNVSPNYEIVYMTQSALAVLCGISLVSVDGFFMLATFHACAQSAVLCKTITNYEIATKHALLSTDSPNRKFKSRCHCLKCIVDNHVSLSKFVGTVDDIFNSIIFARLIMNTSVICGLGYTIVKSSKDSNFSDAILNMFFVTVMTSGLFIYCWISEQLKQEGENVGKTWYERDWYNESSKNAQTVLLPILRSRIPFKITAGKLFEMSLKTYQEWFIKALGYVSVVVAVKSGT